MVSINYSASSAAALNALRDINNQIGVSQKRIATGLKVATASDNASVWATATKLRSESAANATVMSGLSTSQGKAKAATAVLDAVATIYSKMKDAVSLAFNPSSDKNAIDAQVAGYSAQITTLISSNSWLSAAVSEAVTTGVSNGAATSLTLTVADALNVASGDVADSLNLSTGSAGDATTNLGLIDAALKVVMTRTATIATWSDTMDTVKSRLKITDDIRKSAISELVDADMEQEAARVSALQTQQALAYQALSIGNSSSQNILRLFQ